MVSNPYQDQIYQLEKKIQENQILLKDPELNELAYLELAKLKEQKRLLSQAADQIQQAQSQSLMRPNTRHQNAILEFRQGTGGDEAKIWAEELMRMYTRFAENLGLKIEFIDDQVVKIKGKAKINNFDQALTAYELLEFESGVHRVQRVPVTESQGRIHTSTATVAVLPEIHPQVIKINDDDLTWEFMRSGGAGGQSVNKTSSAVRLTHNPSGIVVNARQERKQAQNRQIALELLRSQLWEIQEEARLKKLGQARSSIGRARRAEKIRTYNFPQNRVTDHRIKESWHNLEGIIGGNLEEVISNVIPRLTPQE
ncbi:PCRF domain-containing protein [Patescibacteria group bacterium]|nr:PCRF domain-containing protein [Patescibacteria group bacterium]